MGREAARVCGTCGHLGEPVASTPGSLAIEVVLWLCFLVPGLVYSLWRLSARRDVCRLCGGATLLPVESPLAQAIFDRTSRQQAAVVVPSRRPSAAAYRVGNALGKLLGKR